MTTIISKASGSDVGVDEAVDMRRKRRKLFWIGDLQ